jgi:hypothetical protein
MQEHQRADKGSPALYCTSVRSVEPTQ